MSDQISFPEPVLVFVNKIQLEVFEAGRENAGRPIVLCHGWPENAYSWRYQIPALVAAGYHVIAPNQRGFGNSSCPAEVPDYDIQHLTGDLTALLDYFGYETAAFIGHDWGANVVWNLALLHPDRVDKIVNLALPYQVRTKKPWIEFLEDLFGSDHYFVHFNRYYGIADEILDINVDQFLRNMFRTDVHAIAPEPGMMLINLARAKLPAGNPLMSENELEVFINAFKKTGFTWSINWYRNLDRNWKLLADVNPIIQHPALMIYGAQDMIPKLDNIRDFVPNIDEATLNCGHWIQQEKPVETNNLILQWFEEQNAT